MVNGESSRSPLIFLRLACLVLLASLPLSHALAAQSASESLNPGPGAIEVPSWFRETFLDLREDAREAAQSGRRLMLYFGQDGCPYCRELMQVNFGQKDISDEARRHFVALAINIWGDREVTWTDGRVMSEKALAAQLKVQFTPTLLFLDEKGAVVLRLNGYYPPHRFRATLDYVATKQEKKISIADYLQRHAREPASDRLHDQPFFQKSPLDLDRSHKPGSRPLAVLFEQKQCSACDEMHRAGFGDPAMKGLVGKFDVARVELFGTERLVTPRGRTLTARQWGRELKVAYTPAVVFFDANGREIFRIEAYLKPFHFASSFDYVASGAYRDQPSFQRYIQARAEKIRASGGRVDLW